MLIKRERIITTGIRDYGEIQSSRGKCNLIFGSNVEQKNNFYDSIT
jgi:hypothetical protein